MIDVDFNKPLECDHGTVNVGMSKDIEGIGLVYNITLFEDVQYFVRNKTGSPVRSVALGDEFKVRNAPTNRDKAEKVIRENYRKGAFSIARSLIEAGLLKDGA